MQLFEQAHRMETDDSLHIAEFCLSNDHYNSRSDFRNLNCHSKSYALLQKIIIPASRINYDLDV